VILFGGVGFAGGNDVAGRIGAGIEF
jgi:hypothetical protein